MKTIGIAAGALALVGAATAFAQSTPPSSPATPPPSANTPPSTANTPPTTTTTTPITPTGEAGRDVGGYMAAPVRAPSKAFELGVDAGYTQGFGNIVSGRGV